MSESQDVKPQVHEAGGAEPPRTITVNVIYNSDEVAFKLKTTSKMGKIFDAYARNLNLDRDKLRFSFDGENIKDDDTPDSLGLEEGDRIDCHRKQTGG